MNGSQKTLKELAPLGSPARSQITAAIEPRIRHGGRSSVGKRKTPRPFAPNVATHLVLHSKRAKGTWGLKHRKNHSKIASMVYSYASRFKVHVYRARIDANAIHLLVKTHDRKNLADFLRVLAGRVAIVISGAQKGSKKIGKFWDYLCWSRLVNWGSDFFGVRLFIANEKTPEHERTGAIDSLVSLYSWNLPPDSG